MNRFSFHLFLGLCLIILGQIAYAQEIQQLDSNKLVEREIAGGQEINYQITLAAKQFVRFRLEQNAIDAVLILTAPDGKQLIEMNLTRAGDEENLSFEAVAPGAYRLTVQAKGMATLHGSYKLTTLLKDTATAADKQRILAESLMIESEILAPQTGKAAPQIIEKLQQAAPIWHEQQENSWEAWSLMKIGAAYSNLSQNDKATESFERALNLYQTAKNRSGEGEAIMRLGVVYLRTANYTKSFENLQRALEINREVKNGFSEGQTLVYMGQIQVYQGQFAKGIGYFEQALNTVLESNDQRLLAQLLFSLGNSHLGMSNFEKAIVVFEQALVISQETKNRLYEGTAYANLGSAYGNTSRTEKSIEYTEKALVIYREFKDRVSEISMLINLGNSYLVLGQYEKALVYQQEALKVSREIKNRLSEARALEQIGAVKINQRKFEEAVGFTEQAITIFREIKAQSWEAYSLRSLGVAYYELKQFDKAAAYHEQSLNLSRLLNDQTGTINSLYQLARSEAGRGNLAGAQAISEEGIKTAETLRASLGSSEFRAAYLASDDIRGAYRLYIDLLMQQHKLEPSKNFDALAVEASERQRGRSLLDLLAESKTDLRQGVEPALIEREQALAKQLNDKAQALTKTDKPKEIAALKLEISQLENDLERAQTAIRKSSPHSAALTQPQPLKFKEIQAQLDADTILLEYALGENRSYLWAITQNSLTSYELPKESVIKENALQVYNLLTARNTRINGETIPQRKDRFASAEMKLPAAAKVLSDIILAPAAAQIGNKRLVVVADGALQYIPFAMLPEPVNGRNQTANVNIQPLVINHEIVSLPSASALAIQRTELQNRPPASKTLAVVADPVFDKTDERFKTPTIDASFKPETQKPASADERGLEYIADANSTGKLIIRRLPFTTQEANGLLALAPKTSSFGATGFQANRTMVMSGELANYRYIHFATHGLLDTERPGLSALVLSMVDAKGKAENGFLRTNDIYNMNLPAELVVLSACQTGLGKEVKGEGLVGLTRGFMYAGARRVAVSLWSVNDKATADLMERFYRGMLKDNQRPAAALRTAQIEMWKQKAWQSPYYWSAFIIEGDWR